MDANRPETKNPIWIARETLKRLATQRIAPTPDQYESIYYQIAGAKPPEHHASLALANKLVTTLHNLDLPQEASRHVVDINLAASDQNWTAVAQSLGQLILSQGTLDRRLEQPWGELLLMLWDTRTQSGSDSIRREQLTDAVKSLANHPERLNNEIHALVKRWQDETPVSLVPVTVNGHADAAGTELEVIEDHSLAIAFWRQWKVLLISTLRDGLVPRLATHQHWITEIEFIIQGIEAVDQPENIDWLEKRIRQCWIHMALRVDQEQRLIDGLLNMLNLFIEYASLPPDLDPWVSHQLELIRENLKNPPVLHRIYDAESILKELVYQQDLLQHTLAEAQQTLKDMISLFLERLGIVTEATGEFQQKIDHYTERVKQTNQAIDLKLILEKLMEDTRHMQLDMLRTRDELIKTRQQADATQQRVDELRHHLRQVSEQTRDDRLTGALSHRALVETFSEEQEQMMQSGKPLCLVLLDVDNLSELSSQLGSQASDDTLTHLVQIIKTVIRQGDSVIRYGSEEFLILLPDTLLNTAADMMRRLQRELTKRFFMNNNNRLLITFSAGVTQYLTNESREQALDRADYAVFLARKQGKNQVAVIEALESPVI